jgi:NAD-dependent dihydropyrimidine dehydrogenase PreA subunit
MQVRYLPGVVTLGLDGDKCRGCGRCTEVCPHGVFAVQGGKAAIVDRDACMECGACAKNCPLAAISVEPGVGCAYALIKGLLSGKKPTCGCSSAQ